MIQVFHELKSTLLMSKRVQILIPHLILKTKAEKAKSDSPKTCESKMKKRQTHDARKLK